MNWALQLIGNLIWKHICLVSFETKLICISYIDLFYFIGRDYWGEISSASNCTDYQAKRLNIKYKKFYFDDNNGDILDVHTKYVHTINGTACAIPRMIISIVEQNQTKDGRVIIPEVLRPMIGCHELRPFERK